MLNDTPVAHNRWDTLDVSSPARPTVSVVVAHHRQPSQLALTLAAVGAQTLPPVQVVVADDGSDSPPSVPATVAGVPVTLVTQEHRGFRAAAVRNLGASRATGEVLVFLDADTVPTPGFLAGVTARVGRCRDVVAVGRRLHADLSALAPGDDPLSAPRLDDPAWLSDGYRDSADLLRADGRSFRYVISAVLACRRALFVELGGFDERCVGHGGEDWDLGYRAWNAGAVLIHEPAAVAVHDGAHWAVDHPDRADLDGQALRLATLIPEPSTRGAPLPGSVADVLVDVEAATSAPSSAVDPGGVVRIVHSVLRQTHHDLAVRLATGVPLGEQVAALYAHVLHAAPWSTDQRARARARLTVRAPLPPAALARAMDLVVGRDVGRVVLRSAGVEVAELVSTRAAARARRWIDRLDPAEVVDGQFGWVVIDVGPGPPPAADLGGFFAGPWSTPP